MAIRTLPLQSVLLQLLKYDEETGILMWLERGPEWFKTKRAYGLWNTRFAGTPAMNTIHATGCRYGTLLGSDTKAHRVIWKMMTGEDPSEIDHINGDPADNRWINLREVDRMENMQNKSQSKANRSGHTGVCWHKVTGKWLAKITVYYQTIHLGVFDTFDEAVAARKAAEIEHSFHPNHGRAATGEL